MPADQIQQQAPANLQQDAPAQPQSPLQDQQQQQQQLTSTPDGQQDSTPSSSQIPLIAEETQNVASIADGGRELSKTVLYVGNIHRSVADETLQELFSSLGNPIKSLKILQDKNRPGFNYAFVEYETPEFAEHALQSLDGNSIAENQLKITKAFQTQQVKNSDTFNLFIGDLSLEVNDEVLNSFFQKFPSLVQANVMWDMKSGRSRGYGFVCFDDKKDAEEALQTMNGYMLGDRPIRLNWASHRDRRHNNNNNSNSIHNHHNNGGNNFGNSNHYNNNNNLGNNNNNYYNNGNLNSNLNSMININGMNNNNNNNNTNNNTNTNGGNNLMNNNMGGDMSNSMNMMNMNMMNNSGFNNGNPSNAPNSNNNILMKKDSTHSNMSMGNINSINNINSIDNGGNKMRHNMMSMNSMDMMNNQSNGNMNSMINRPPVMGPPSYEMVLRQAPSWLSAVYLGNLADYTTQNDLIPLLQNFGYIVNFKLLSHKGYAFVTYDTHERAAMAIVQLSGFTINGRPLKCGWGKSNKVVSDIRNISPDVRIP
ncbi:hypothetical protein PMKS-003976 [Pichia membranifaciens]|uniref:RRM domain-containing protein n=1 Tax=Pichia membranifaciens TaxID=4926 RepID=A0A1Q2YLN4_9ASCO|nr:hypothetical protein PMKS-003976 [Pichia membranifaciens]